MPQINRIVFTGDAFRTYAGERSQVDNVRWLSRHFSPLLMPLTGLPTEIRLAGGEPFENEEVLRSWYRILGSEPCMTSWAKHFDAIPSQELIEAVAADFRDALVISIEISPLLQRILDACDIPWIDIGISPLRFLEDYAISFRLSRHFEGKFPAEMMLGEEDIQRAVKLVCETYRSSPDARLDGAVVFFAQTSEDRTLIKDGKFIGAQEALDGLREIRSDRRVLVKPHPLDPGNPVVAAVISEFSAAIIDINTYEILSSSADVSVATLASSVGLESKAFGKCTHIFHPDVQSAAFSGPSSLEHAFSASLWKALLSPLIITRDIETAPWQPNRLRREIGYYGLDPAVWEEKRNVAFYDMGEAERIGLTEKAIAERRTLYERWENLAAPEAEPWNERAAIAASYLKGERSVADFGCGTMSLKNYLDAGVDYIPVDVSPRGPDTIVCDFNVGPPPKMEATAVACLGVLEYLFEPQQFMTELAKTYSKCVLSYCITDAVETAPNRRAHAWVNDFSRAEIEDMLRASGWEILKTEPIGTFQQMWKLGSKNSERSWIQRLLRKKS